MSTYSRDQLIEMASGYALGALSVAETAAVEAALPGDSALAAEVQSMRETMGAMLMAEPPIVPRAGLRAEWLQRARQAPAHAPATTDVRRLAARRRSHQLTWFLGSAIAASLTGIIFLGLQTKRTREQLDVATATAAKRERQLNTVLEADAQLQVAMLDGDNEHGTGAQFFWNARQNRGMVHAFHLPPAPAGREYQLWVHRGETPISVRIFNSGADGHALIEQLVLPASPSGIRKVSITVEPAGGSRLPTTQPILSGELLMRSVKRQPSAPGV
jgi:anti-sigma-K factor RskA